MLEGNFLLDWFGVLQVGFIGRCQREDTELMMSLLLGFDSSLDTGLNAIDEWRKFLIFRSVSSESPKLSNSMVGRTSL